MNSRMTMKRAVLIPFVIMIMVAILTFVVSWRVEYNQLSNEHSDRILTLTSQDVSQRLYHFFAEPMQLSQVFNDLVMYQELYGHNLESLEGNMRSFYKSYYKRLPQISVVFYGDENQRFLGFRYNGEDDFSLMLQDARTDFKLKIYEGEEISEDLLDAIDGYDPTERPWYAPVKENPVDQWSDIYVNENEIQDTTISVMHGVIDKAGNFIGVTGMDIKLDRIQEFLSKESENSGVLLYILDDKDNLIAASNGALSKQELYVHASRSHDVLIQESFKHLDTEDYFLLDGDKYYVGYDALDERLGLTWYVVSVLSEDQMMGGVKTRQDLLIIFVLIVILIGATVAMIYITRLVKPIKTAADAAMVIAQGNWDVTLERDQGMLVETEELIDALALMRERLMASFASLQKNEAKYRGLVENLDEMVYSISSKRRFISVNHPFEQYFGVNRDQVMNVEVKPFFKRHTYTDQWFDQYLKVLEDGKPLRFQLKIEKEMIRQVLSCSLVPIKNGDNEIDMVLGSISDITELVLALERLSEIRAKENEKLEALVSKRSKDLEMTIREYAEREQLASLGSLVSGITHEINTPLGVAVTTASYIAKINDENRKLLEDNKMTKSGFVKFMDNLNESVEILNTNLYRASELIKSFKMIAVNQSHRRKERFNVYAYLEAVIISLKHELKQGGHEVAVHIPEDLKIYSDPGVLSQILTNFIMNSIKHGFVDRQGGQIEVTIKLEEGEVALIYSDNGKGIPSENLDKIFEPYFTSNRQAGGTGLGLSVVKSLIEDLDGTVTCESEEGIMTTFIVRLPMEE